jgi:hypothetical protein
LNCAVELKIRLALNSFSTLKDLELEKSGAIENISLFD